MNHLAMLSTVAGDRFRVLTDTGVIQQGQGYERVMLLDQWHPDDSLRIVRIWIRVDRWPGNSFAKASYLFGPEREWVDLYSLGPDSFWHDAPGWARWRNSSAEVRTRAIAQVLMLGALEHIDNIKRG